MTATFRKTDETTNRKREEPTKAGGASISRIAVARPSAIAGSNNGGTPPLEPGDLSGRQLRNRLIVANAIAWIVIIFLIGLVFF
jgi:hypothetical protein